MKAEVNYRERYCQESLKKYGLLYSRAELYESIYDFPYLKWIELGKGNKEAACKTKGLFREIDIIILENTIRTQIIDNFGVNTQLNEYLDKKVELEIMLIDQISNPDPSNLIFIRVLEIEIQEMEAIEDKNSNDFDNVCSYLGYALPTETTIYRLFDCVKSLNKKGQTNG